MTDVDSAVQQPLVSVVIPVYNGANYLAEAIDSALAQSWPNIEVIIVDDGSDDAGATAGVAAGYGERIRYLHKCNGGTASAVNEGIRAMRGEYFSWLSHDDVYANDKIERQVRVLTEVGRPAMAFSDFATIDAAGRVLLTCPTGDGYDPGQPLWALFENRINGCATLVHRTCLEQCGLFDPGLPGTHDYDLWFRIALRFPLVHAPGIAVYHRRHDRQASNARRFGDEVVLLWTSMLDRIAADTRRAHANSDASFFARLLQSPVVTGLPRIRLMLENRIGWLLEGIPVGVALGGNPRLDDVVGVCNRVQSGHGRVLGVAMAQSLDSSIRSLELQWRQDNSTIVDVLDARIDGTESELLRRCASLSEARYVWILDESETGTRVPVMLLVAMCGVEDVVACIPAYAPGCEPDGAYGPLAGSIIDRAALERAMADCTGTMTSVIQALVRLGRVVTYPVAHPTSADCTVVNEVSGADRAATRPARTLSLPVHASMFLRRRPRLAGVMWLLLRVTMGQRAQKRLLAWSGLQGLIDPDWYLRAYPEVAAAGVDPVFHYLIFGDDEGRDPSPDFCTRAYLNRYPEVTDARLNPLQHFATWGHALDYRPQPSPVGRALPASPDHRPALLCTINERSSSPGDLQRFCQELTEQLDSDFRILFLCARSAGFVALGTAPDGQWGRTFDPGHELERLRDAITVYAVRRVLILCHGGFNGRLRAILESLDLPFDLVVLDDALISSSGAASAPDEQRDRCWLTRHASAILACSGDLAARLADSGVTRGVAVKPPPDPDRLRKFRPWPRPRRPGQPLGIALFGDITPACGHTVVRQAVDRARAQNLPIRFFLFGQFSPTLPRDTLAQLHVVPVRNHDDLTRAVVEIAPHLAWFPFQLPVSCSYAITDAEANGLPIAATQIGEVRERLEKRPLTWLRPLSTGIDEWLELFLAIDFNECAPVTAPPCPHDYIRNDIDAWPRYLRSVG